MTRPIQFCTVSARSKSDKIGNMIVPADETALDFAAELIRDGYHTVSLRLGDYIWDYDRFSLETVAEDKREASQR